MENKKEKNYSNWKHSIVLFYKKKFSINNISQTMNTFLCLFIYISLSKNNPIQHNLANLN